ncbi:MAG: hypothetical protein U0528_10765 [Anaerolineae bacterium]|nr:DUF2007 domain-containing protein [Anaerolineae bacterium]
MSDLPTAAPNNWIVVASVGSLTEASILFGRLKHLGIPAIIQNDSLLGSIGVSLGGAVKVLVPEKWYEFTMATLYPDEDVPLLEDGLQDEEELEDEEWQDDE